MIVFDLACAAGHRFEGWFASSDAFADHVARNLVGCPQCGDTAVVKAPMAPAVPGKGTSRASAKEQAATNIIPPEIAKAMRALAHAQANALKSSTWVGDTFAETCRAMHYGEREHAVIHGRATADEARALVDEGVKVAPLPFPVAAPDEIN